MYQPHPLLAIPPMTNTIEVEGGPTVRLTYTFTYDGICLTYDGIHDHLLHHCR
jgi:hypothetical protein